MDMTGIAVEADGDGFARIGFLNAEARGHGLRALLDAGGPGLIDVDTRGERKTYIVPESIAIQAGFLRDPDAQPLLPEGTPTEAWTVAQLRTLASIQGVDLTGVSVKADILARLVPADPGDAAAPAEA